MNLSIQLWDPELIEWMQQMPEEQHSQIATDALRGWMIAYHSTRDMMQKLNLGELHETQISKLQGAFTTFQSELLGGMQKDGKLSIEMKSILSSFFKAENEDGIICRLEKKLAEHDRTLLSAVKDLNDKIVAVIAGEEATQIANQSSPAKGNIFEQDFANWLQSKYVAPNSLIASHVGRVKGSMRGFVGDLVIRSTPDHILNGRSIAFEAKSVNGYSLDKAREEIERAKRNRDAQAGIFIFDKSCAPPEIPFFHREGLNFFTVWQTDDETTQHCVEVVIELAIALLADSSRTTDNRQSDADVSAIQKVAASLEAHLLDLNEMQKQVAQMQTSASKQDRLISKLIEKLSKDQGSLDAVIDGFWDNTNETNITRIAP